MPGLPGSSPTRDLRMFRELFQREEFRPDMLKIYPCLVLRGSDLFDIWRKGEYIPYTTKDVVDLLVEVMPSIPHWVRIQRMQRDIPKQLIVGGPTAGNLTQLVFRQAEERGYPINTIRYREIGYKQRSGVLEVNHVPNAEALTFHLDEYTASGGTEFFLSLEDTQTDSLVGYLRLRIPSSAAHRPEVRRSDSALLRELHVYGLSVDLGGRIKEAWQHRGLGARLLNEAEEVALGRDCKQLICTSGIGARQYYLRHGYRHDGPYVTKRL